MSIFSKLFGSGESEDGVEVIDVTDDDDDEREDTVVTKPPPMADIQAPPLYPSSEAQAPKPPPRQPAPRAATPPPLRPRASAAPRTQTPSPDPAARKPPPIKSRPAAPKKGTPQRTSSGDPATRPRRLPKDRPAPAPSRAAAAPSAAAKRPPKKRETARKAERKAVRPPQAAEPKRAAKSDKKDDWATARKPRPSLFGDVPDGALGEALGAELDARFDAATGDGASGVTASEQVRADEASRAAVRATFIEVAARHLRQVREAMLEIRFGAAPSAAVGPARAAVEVVEQAAKTLGEDDIRDHLATLARRLRGAQGAPLSSETRRSILSAYEKLIELSPEHLELQEEHARREPVVVRSLVMQVPRVEQPTVERLFAAGLGALSSLIVASADEIQSVTGLRPEIAKALADKAAEYRREFGETAASIEAEADHQRLGELVQALRKEQSAYLDAAAKWTDEAFANKRRRREARRQVLLQVDVVLARLGELDRIAALERAPIARRIELLDQFIADQSGEVAAQ